MRTNPKTGKILIHRDFVRVMPNYQIRAGAARGTCFYYTPFNFIKLFEVIDS